MPLRKTKQGWFWGSKGPFPDKAKALQVARAAYASGYKGESDKKVLVMMAENKFFQSELIK